MKAEQSIATFGPGYAAAYANVVRYDASACGRLRLAERDRADLLHRLSTNDIRGLRAGDGTRTVLTNHNARIIDLLTVYVLPEHVLVVTSPDKRSTVLNTLRKNIFFNDRVVVEDLTDQTLQYALYGPAAAQLVGQITGLDTGSWPLHHVQAASIEGAQVWLARTLPIGGDGFVLLGRVEDRLTVESALEPATPLDDATLDLLRVEHGYPASGRELSLEYIPLETRLSDAVSFNKGCYVGQEIIARMESRNRLAKQMMGLRLERPVDAGGKLERDGKEMGDLTSVVESPRFGAIGLGYVRTAAAEPGMRLDAGGVAAEVVELPFQDR